MPEIAALLPQIRGAAHNIAQQYNADPDDVEQEIVLAILERYSDDPDFLTNRPAYIVNHGAWRARDALRWQVARHAKRELLASDLFDAEEGNDPDEADLFAEDPWPQVSLSLTIEEALSALSEENQQIAHGLAAGYSPREIASQVGRSFRTVYTRMSQVIAPAMADV